MDAVAKITAARVQALTRWPYAATILFAFKLVPVTQGLETMAVDKGLRLYYNPSFVDSNSVQGLATVLLHEVLHVVHNHADRFGNLKAVNPSHEIWNIAGDLGINHILFEAGMSFSEGFQPITFDSYPPSVGLDPEKPTEDAFYKLNTEKDEGEEGERKPGDIPKPGLSEGDENPSDDVGDKAPGDEPGDESGSSPGHGNCGSISDGIQKPYELPGDDHEAPAATGEEIDVILDGFATDAINFGREHGNLPKGLARAVDDYLDPKIDWRRQLAALIRREVASISGRKDYTYRRPSRRQDALRGGNSEIILPAMRQQPPPNIAVVYDTSGSMSQQALTAGMSEILGITEALAGKAQLFAIPCDEKPHDVFQIKSQADISKVKPLGGGGTNMPAGIHYASKLKPAPKIIVVITDGYTPWPDQKPRNIHQILVILTERGAEERVPSWMPTLHLDN